MKNMQLEASRSLSPTSSFLVIRSANIGDLVCTTPLIHALRRHYPRARICALVNSYNAPVLQNNPDLDEVYAYTKLKHRMDGAGAWRVLWDRMALMARLRRQRFDCAIVAGARFLPRGLRLARMIRPRHIIGFTEQGRGLASMDLAIPYELPRPLHEVEDVFRLLAPLSIAGEPPAIRVFPDAGEVRQIRSRLESRLGTSHKLRIGVHISARKPSNRWLPERYAQLIRILHDKHDAAFLLFWSPGAEDHPHHPGDDNLAARLVQETQGVPLLPCPTHRLQELIAGLSCCDALVCSDGGALHVAAALGKPILCFFGDSEASRWHPWKVPYELLQPASRNVGDVTVEQALHGFERLLSRQADAARGGARQA